MKIEHSEFPHERMVNTERFLREPPSQLILDPGAGEGLRAFLQVEIIDENCSGNETIDESWRVPGAGEPKLVNQVLVAASPPGDDPLGGLHYELQEFDQVTAVA